MRFVSWNVNGFRAALKSGFAENFAALNADIVCLQETKMHEGQAEFEPIGYCQFWNSAEKKGYSGTAVFARRPPIEVRYHIGPGLHREEGRAITLEYPAFFLVNVYTPNAQQELRRIEYRMRWEDDLREYLLKLDAEKPVVYCGDLNVAHNEIDIKNPGANRGQAGFSDRERDKMTQLLSSGFTDTFRALYPYKKEAYTWWSYRGDARARNTGWRIDYFIVSERLMDRVEDSLIFSGIAGSDHCPVGLELALY